MKISFSGPKQGYTEYNILTAPYNEIEAASVKEIFAADAIDLLSCKDVYTALKVLTSKLRHGGKLIIGGTDITLVAKAIVTQQLNLVDANNLIHGVNCEKHTQISMSDLIDLLRSLGLVVTRKVIDGYGFFVEGVRN